MRTRRRTKLVHEGMYVAEVEVGLIETDESWAPYLSLEDAYKLDDAREALRRGDNCIGGAIRPGLHSYSGFALKVPLHFLVSGGGELA